MRGFAVMYVVIDHCLIFREIGPFSGGRGRLWRASPLWSLDLAGGCFGQGEVLVMGGAMLGLFYIISGFVLVVGYAQPTRSGDLPALDSRDFLRKRFARVAPVYFLSNVGIVVGLLALGVGFKIQPLKIALTALGLTSWALMQPFPNGVTWTISTMFFFYLCFPAPAPRIQRIMPHNLRTFALGMYALQAGIYIVGFLGLLLVAEMSMYQSYWIRTWPPARLPVFVMGMCCGLQRIYAERARTEGVPAPSQRRPMAFSLAGCGCCQPVTGLAFWWLIPVLLGSAATFSCSAVSSLRMVLEILYPILFYDWIYSATDPEQQGSLVARLFSSRFMVFLGDISMCVYMTHMMLVSVLGLVAGKSYYEAPWWSVFAVPPVAVIVGWLATRFIETPAANCLRPMPRSKCQDAARRHSACEVVGSAVSVNGSACACDTQLESP